MKKFILFIVLLLSVASCSSVGDDAQTGGADINETKTIEALKAYNASILDSCKLTRGGRTLIVASADVVGAIRSISAGKTLAGIFGAASGGAGFAAIVVGTGLIGGAASSYLAYKGVTTCSYPATIPELFYYTKKIVNGRIVTVKQPNDTEARTDEDRCDVSQPAQDVLLPKNFSYLKSIGADHNAILRTANVDGELPCANIATPEDLEPVLLNEEETELYEKAMSSQELKDYFYEAMGDVRNGKGIETLTCSERVKQALKEYLDLFQTYPENVDELVEIANGYIRIIEENNEFTKDEKELIYAGIMVSVYSPQLWDNFK